MTTYETKEHTLVPLGISCCSVLSFSLILSLLLCYVVWLNHQKTKKLQIQWSFMKFTLSASDLCVEALWILWGAARTSWAGTLFQNNRFLACTSWIIFRAAAPGTALVDRLGIDLISRSNGIFPRYLQKWNPKIMSEQPFPFRQHMML